MFTVSWATAGHIALRPIATGEGAEARSLAGLEGDVRSPYVTR
jgi:hypothetical protein